MPTNIYFYLFHGLLALVLWLNFQPVHQNTLSPCPASQPVIIRTSHDERALNELSGEVRSLGQQLQALQTDLPQSIEPRDPFFHSSLLPTVSPIAPKGLLSLANESKAAHPVSSSSVLTQLPKSLVKSPKPEESKPVKPAVPVEELSMATEQEKPDTLDISPPIEPRTSPAIELDGYTFSLKALTGQQERLLRTIAKIPKMPTEYIRGARYVRVGAKRYLDDCSNVLRIAYEDLGIDLFSERYHYPKANGVRLIRMKGLTSSASTSSTTVAVGDLVIFDNTYDRNKNGRLDDRDTHAAIVVGFEDAETAVIYHRVRSGHKIGRLNLKEKNRVFSSKGRHRLNNVLRRVAKKDRAKVPRLTGQLFATYVRVIPPETMPLSYLSK